MKYLGMPKTTYYRKKRKAKELGCSIDEVPDMRGKNPSPKGKEHPRWNSSKIISSDGYAKIRVGRNHPLADPNGYAYEHVLVAITAGLNLASGNVIHHKNGDKTDNRVENLEVISRAEHNREHNKNRERDAKGKFTSKKAAGRKLDGRTWDEFPEVP